MMKFEDLVSEALIDDCLTADSSTEAIIKMADVLRQGDYVDDRFSKAIIAREKLHPSGLPMNVRCNIAIPHTDAIYVNQSVIYFARLSKPLNFHVMGSPEETVSVQLISMFALKEKEKIGDLLETLITMYQDNAILNAIQQAKGVHEIFQILHSNMKRYQKI
jgi:galactitol PTS system EIIA component